MSTPTPADLLASFASPFSHQSRLLQLHFNAASGIPADTLLPWKLSGKETLNTGYRFELTALANDAFIPLKTLIGQPIAVSILTDQGDYRPLTGWVTEARALGADGGFAQYLIVFEDLFAVLDRRINQRVFQDITAKDAFLTIVREHQSANPVLAASLDIDDRCSRDYPAQSWITQYDESDAAFGRRRLAEEGIHVSFGSAWDGDHIITTLILFDAPTQLADLGRVRFHRADGTESADSITDWVAERRLIPASVAAASYDYKPVDVSRLEEATRLDQGETGSRLAATLSDYRHDIPHQGNDGADYERYASLRMQAYESAAKQFSGQGSVRHVRAGERFTLIDHPEIDAHDPQDRRFALTEVEIKAVNNLPVEIAGEDQGAEQPFRTTFTAQRDTAPLTPAYRHSAYAKPNAPQQLTGVVVGPAQEEIHTDALGRIRVNLRFPRAQDHAQGGASQNETDSVWLRVAQAWTGTEYGALFIPRVGDEVSIGFIGGDIDRPIVTGTVYNGTHRPPSFSHAGDLPGNKTLSGVKSKMYKGAGANEIVFDDTTDEQRIRLATDHGQTALNQGYLVHPRVDGKGTPRGEGFELRTDQAGSVRAAKGLLIATDARPRAQGKQLDRQELISQLEAALDRAEQLAGLSDTHHAESTDTKPQEGLLKSIKDWEQGSNTTTNTPSPVPGEGGGGGQPFIAVSAPAGIALSTPQAMSMHAGTNCDLIAGQDANLTQGRNFRARAKDAISLFVHKLGMKLISASGKIKIEAHSDNIEITAAKKIFLTGLENVNFKAPKITYLAQQAGYEIGQGQITSKTTGKHTRHAGKHALKGPAGAGLSLPVMPVSQVQIESVDLFSQQFDLSHIVNNEIVEFSPENMPYRVLDKSGKVIVMGSVNDEGLTERIFTKGEKDLIVLVGDDEWQIEEYFERRERKEEDLS